MRAFITGITGFSGPYLAEHLLASGDTVRGASRGGSWGGDIPALVREQVPVFAWDVASSAEVEQAARELAEFAPEVIYHLAAISVPSECGTAEPTPVALQANVVGTANVLQLAARLDPVPRIVFASSSHVYAPAAEGSAPVAETAPCLPARAYGKTKLAAEQLLLSARQMVPCVISRSFQHTGPRQSTKMMLPEWAEQFAAGTNPVQVLNRDTLIDLTDVRDVVRAYRLLATEVPAGGIYNVGSGVGRRTGDILNLLQQMADPQREIHEMRPGRRFDPVANIDAIGQATGWRPEIPLEVTVADTLEYFRQRSSH